MLFCQRWTAASHGYSDPREPRADDGGGLLRSCPHLRSLGEMEGWEGVSAAEIEGLRARIRHNNWDLDIDWTWSGY